MLPGIARANQDGITPREPPPWLIGRRPIFGFDFEDHQQALTGTEVLLFCIRRCLQLLFRPRFLPHPQPSVICDFAIASAFEQLSRSTVQHIQTVKMGESRFVSARPRVLPLRAPSTRFRTRTDTEP
jgi:hypothetical protein